MSSLARLAVVWAASTVVLLTVWIFVMTLGKRRRVRVTITRGAALETDLADTRKETLQQSA